MLPDANFDQSTKMREAYIWALKDVTLHVNEGEIVGIIGPNGAGKTTLLKILSRITEPTEGYAQVRGRVGSLLHVGTGFHPELTGRENIYLNGAILGMKKAEVEGRFDQIVGFADLENFIDTPLKFYSDGMYIRLAFAVAAHLEPDILLVDEVLAVGDAAFQKKSLGKMSEVAHQGRTVLFVSHNMAAISSLCDRACLLDKGRLTLDGPAKQVVGHYLKTVSSTEVIQLDERRDRSGDGSVTLFSLQVQSADHDAAITSTSRLRINVGYRSRAPLRYPRFLIEIHDYADTGIFLLDSDAAGGLPEELPSEGNVSCLTDRINLTAGRCYLSIKVFRARSLADGVQNAGYFDIYEEDVYGTGKTPRRDSVFYILSHRWNFESPNR